MLTPASLVQLVLMSILPAALSWLTERVRQMERFRRIRETAGQVLIGSAFGLLSVCMTLLGVETDGALIDARDAAPICAGLLFGAPGGVVAGLIGGVQRLLCHAGDYTRLADAVTTVAAGVCAACLRRWMFDDKRPKWYYAFALGAVVEILHMLMIILTHMQDIHAAFAVVKACALPVALANALAAMLAAAVLTLRNRAHHRRRSGPQNITHSFGRSLLAVVLVAFAVTMAFSWLVETQMSVTDAVALMKLNIRDVRQDIIDASDENLLRLTQSVADELDETPDVTQSTLTSLMARYDVAEINVIGPDGVIIATTDDSFLGYDMAQGEQASAFVPLLHGTTHLVQSYQPISYDQRISRKYAGVVLERGGFVQVAYDARRFQRDIDSQVIGVTKNRHIGDSGFIVIADENGVIVSDRHDSNGRALAEIGLNLASAVPGERFACAVYGTESFCIYAESEGYSIIAVIPRAEVLLSRDVSLYLTVFMEAILFSALYVLIYHLIRTRIVDNIRRINRSLAEITGGDLDVVVDVRANEEFASLSDDINATVLTLKRYIAEAAARIDQELEFARTIQHSALPHVFPERSEIDLHARMFTAKEVGGDFYDFYFVDATHLAFVVADVSGKGIPAAMFMMTAKTLLKSCAESGREVEDVFVQTNESLCEHNEANMFVTAWMGILDLKTGVIEYANAGHNPPLVRRKDGSYEYLRIKPGFVLAGLEGMPYRKNSLQLAPGDTIFLYTDGVTEANDESGALYGESRLIHLLNGLGDGDVRTVCEEVKRDLDDFAGNAPQFDDITMLCLRLNRFSRDGA